MTATATLPRISALQGDVVTQGDADACAARGHLTHLVDGVDQERCPRCGETTGPSAALVERFEAMLDADREARWARASVAFRGTGMSLYAMEQQGRAAEASKAKADATFSTFSLAELQQFRTYRRGR